MVKETKSPTEAIEALSQTNSIIFRLPLQREIYEKLIVNHLIDDSVEFLSANQNQFHSIDKKSGQIDLKLVMAYFPKLKIEQSFLRELIILDTN